MEMAATCFAPAATAAAGISRTRCSAANIVCRPSFLGGPATARVRRTRSCKLAMERRATSATLQDHGFSFSPDDFAGKMEELVQSMNTDHHHRRNRAGEISGPSFAGDGGCPVKRAFSSTVFIISEVQSFVLRLREALFYQDLEKIIRHVQSELHASFVWLFQSIFSHTPTLMVYLLIFLANFTVFSMDKNPVFPAAAAATVIVSEAPDASEQSFSQFDRQIPRSIFDSACRTASIGGGDGVGKPPPVAGAMEDGGDGWSLHYGRRQLSLTAEKRVWEAMVEEAARMSAVDQSAMRGMVSPVKVELESDDEYAEYLRTELQYHSAVAADPDNTLLLSNFAQFLLAVRHDHDRAEEYFKRAAAVRPADAAAIGQYAAFLWMTRGDMEAAEEAYLEAIAADPGNTYYAANYAHFLWNTGGEDTCFPLDGDGDGAVGHCHGGSEL